MNNDKSHRQVLIERFTAYLTQIDRLEAVSPGSLAVIAITAPSTVNLEDKVIEAALNLCAVSGAHAIKLPIKNTTPPLFVTIGEAGSLAPSTGRRTNLFGQDHAETCAFASGGKCDCSPSSATLAPGMVMVPIETLDRIARDCEHGSRIWRECDALLREYRLSASTDGKGQP